MNNNIQHKAFQTQFNDMTEGLVTAYVSVYGNVDSANEICDYGCFKDSLAYKPPVFCLYHNWEKPIGKVTLAEEIPAGDERLPVELKEYGGLYIEAQINLDKEMGRDAWSDIKHGVLDEYSIGYVVKEDYVDKKGYRHLSKVDLIEASPVVRAANRMTKTIEVKSVKIPEARTSVIVDIDGTLLNDNNDGIQKNVDYVNNLYDEYHIDIVTGRRDTQRTSTEDQLQAAGIKYNALHMFDFPEGAPVIEYKKYKAERLLEEFNDVHLAIDNDSDVRDMYESLGINSMSPGDIPETADKSSKEPYIPNEGMKEEAARALKWKEDGREGGTRIGLTRANQIVNGENLSEETVKRMYSFFARHEVDKQAEGFEVGEDGYPSPGRVAWGLWGGDAGFSWSKNIVEQLQNQKDFNQINNKSMKELLDQIQEYLTAVMGPLDELKILLAQEGLYETTPSESMPATADATKNEDATEEKALDLGMVMEMLTEIMAQVTEMETQMPEMADANTENETKSLSDIKEIVQQLMDMIAAETAPAQEAPKDAEGSKAVESHTIPLSEQIELEQLFSKYLNSQFNIN